MKTLFFLCITLSVLRGVSTSAGWVQISQTETTLGSETTTNIVLGKIQGTRMRLDPSAEVSILLMAENGESFQIVHPTKTFTRLTASRVKADFNPVNLPQGRQVIIDRLPGVEICVTNGPETATIWTVNPTNFHIRKTQVGEFLRASPDPSARVAVGALLSSNSLVYATEYKTETNSRERLITMTKLISLFQTNCSPSEFEIPSGYIEVPNNANNPVSIPREAFGSRFSGENNLEGARKDLGSGRALLLDLRTPHLMERNPRVQKANPN